jgi:hypothetical protein
MCVYVITLQNVKVLFKSLFIYFLHTAIDYMLGMSKERESKSLNTESSHVLNKFNLLKLAICDINDNFT